MVLRPIIVTALIAFSAGVVRAQEQVMVPLADVARQAEASKATARKAKKTYTNANLTADPRGDSAPPPAPAAAAAPAATAGTVAAKPATLAGATAAGEAKADEQEKESEESWRARAAGMRTQVERIGARLRDLTTPNRLRDENPGVKAATDIEVKNTRDALDRLRNQWQRLEASAVERKIPLAWIQPQPVFPQ